jgi:predicted transcriptional regulator
MSNIITIELCAEDRARLDRLAEALERKACEKCVSAALEVIGNEKQPTETDPVQQAFADVLAKANTPTEKPTEATGASTAEAAPIDHPAEEDLPDEADAPAEEAKPTVTQDQLQQKVMQLAAANNGALKAKVREIVNAYAKKVSDVPEDKRAEVWDKLTALEKGGQA